MVEYSIVPGVHSWLLPICRVQITHIEHSHARLYERFALQKHILPRESSGRMKRADIHGSSASIRMTSASGRPFVVVPGLEKTLIPQLGPEPAHERVPALAIRHRSMRAALRVWLCAGCRRDWAPAEPKGFLRSRPSPSPRTDLPGICRGMLETVRD
jgi:hypothetical protein